MKNKEIEERIVKEVKVQLSSQNFEFHSLDLEKEHYVNFIYKLDGLFYVFGLYFLLFKDSLSIEPTIFVSYDEVTRMFENAIKTERSRYNGWLAISSRIGILLNPKNKNGFFNDNDCIHIENVRNTEKSIEKAVSVVINKYFKVGAMDFIEKTKTLEKADALINGWVLKGEGSLKSLAYFGSHRPWQITTGIMVAKIVNRPDYNELLDRYLIFAKTKDPEQNEWIRNFYLIVDYLKKV